MTDAPRPISTDRFAVLRAPTKALRLLTGVLMLVTTAAHAGPPSIAIGRVKLHVQEESWVVHEGPRRDIPIKDVHVDVVPGEVKIVTLRGAEVGPVAAIDVFATWGSAGVYSWSDCKPVDGMYVRNLANSRFAEAQCLRFGGPYDAEALIASGFGHFAEARKRVPIEVPPIAYAISVHMSTDDGSIIQISGFVDGTLVGLTDRKPAGAVPARMEPAHAAWADAVAEAALASIRSVSGKLVMPPTTFRARPPARAVAVR